MINCGAWAPADGGFYKQNNNRETQNKGRFNVIRYVYLIHCLQVSFWYNCFEIFILPDVALPL